MTSEHENPPPPEPTPAGTAAPVAAIKSAGEAVPAQAASPPATPQTAQKIWLCADDFGLSPKVNEAICDLILRGRINATSAMVVAPAFSRAETLPLSIFRSGSQRAALGLHLTLTAPFRPLSPIYAPLRAGAFPPLKTMLTAALLRRLEPERIAVEVGAQIKAFIAAFGHAPDFVDGHQHVHVFPQVRDAVIAAVKQAAPQAWLRQCSRGPWLGAAFSDPKGLLIDRLSRGLRRRAAIAGLKTNPAFAGTYSFKASADYAALFPRFLKDLPDGSVVMCHPGHVDDTLRRLDPLTDLREKEYAYFAGDNFPKVLQANGVTLA